MVSRLKILTLIVRKPEKSYCLFQRTGQQQSQLMTSWRQKQNNKQQTKEASPRHKNKILFTEKAQSRDKVLKTVWLCFANRNPPFTECHQIKVQPLRSHAVVDFLSAQRVSASECVCVFKEDSDRDKRRGRSGLRERIRCEEREEGEFWADGSLTFGRTLGSDQTLSLWNPPFLETVSKHDTVESRQLPCSRYGSVWFHFFIPAEDNSAHKVMNPFPVSLLTL